MSFFDLPPQTILQVAMNLFSMILGLLLFGICLSENDEKKDVKISFLRLISAVFVSLCIHSAAWIIDGNTGLRPSVIVCNTLLFTCGPMIIYTFFLYILDFYDLKEESGLGMMRKVMRVAFVCTIAIALFNLIFPFYFRIDASGTYHRGSLYHLSHIYVYLCTLALVFIIIRYRKRVHALQSAILLAFLGAPIVIMFFSAFSHRLTPVYSICMTVLLILYCSLNVKKNREHSAMKAELDLATKIQADMLPNLFPAFPDRKEFDLWASMTPAKEVGGDFYDFFFIDRNRFAIVIADVSGKGIPAAIFMMMAKVRIKDRAMRGGTPAEILYDVNNAMCKHNEEDLFVTVWLAIIDLTTGEGLETNAGHEHPVFEKNDAFAMIEYPHSPPLAIIEGLDFEDRAFTLEPKDALFVYTDGVTEAANAQSELFGEERLMSSLEDCTDASCERTLKTVRSAIDTFVQDAPQFDDITMLTFRYNGVS